MKVFNYTQGTDEWFRARLGIPTSSCFDKIITPKTGKMSSQHHSYLCELFAEIILNEPLDRFPANYWMERGSVYEEDAAQSYQLETGHNVIHGGFITDDDLKWGTSLDRLIVDDSGEIIGGLEIKCPAPWTHVENLLNGDIDTKYIPQVQGQILVGELDFVDWYSYHPQIPSSLIRTEPDAEYQAKLKTCLNDFQAKKEQYAKILIDKGALDKMPEKVMPEITDEETGEYIDPSDLLLAG